MKSGNSDGAGDSDGGQLLEEIEAISKALYLHRAPTNAFLCPSDGRLKSRLAESKLKFDQGSPREELLLNDRRSSSTWNWKKPLKALTHIRHRKFSCVFYLNVHSIEGLPANFDGCSLSVHWKRKDEVLETRPSKVFQGMAEFNEILIHKCSLYGGRSLANHSAKYDPKLFLIYVSVLGAPRYDIGKHWVDLTRILPLTLEELEGEKSSGNWSTSFQLTGNARGASLNVSFSFLVMRDDSVKLSGHENVFQLLKLLQNRSNIAAYGACFTSTNLNGLPSTDGNISHGLKYGSIPSTKSVDMGIFHEPHPRLELSKSINLLYRKMDEGDQCRSEDSGSEFFELLKSRSDKEHQSGEDINGSGYDCGEFSIIECGIELAGTEGLNLDNSTVKTIDVSKVETIYLGEIMEDDKVSNDNKLTNMLKDAICDIHVDDPMVDDFKYEENNLQMEEVTGEELSSDFDHNWTSQLVESDPPLVVGELVEQENDVDRKENCARRSPSLDDSIESVASDFLSMLGLEHGSSRFSEADPLSPRERLLRQFEEESLVFGNSVLDFTATEEFQDFGSVDLLESACDNDDEDFDLLSIYVAEEGQEEVHQSLRGRRNAKILEDLETEVLMREWGLNEMDFQHSPRYSSSGFGSPIELPPEEPLKLHSLGEGFGPCLKMKNGGFLRSMNPSLFQNTRNGQSLIVQCSDLVVLPSVMGYDIMEISQNLAMAGIENLSMLTSKLMPLDDITGKTLQQMTWECAPGTMVRERESMLQNKLSGSQVSFCAREDHKGLPCHWNHSSLGSPFLDSQMNPDLVSPDDLAFLAMDKIQTLLIEGLRIQCGMTDDEAPSRINAPSSQCAPAHGQVRSNLDGEELQFINWPDPGGDFVGLMDLSIPLDDWLRLDTGIIDDDDQNGQHIMKILVAHGANYADIVGRLSKDINSGTSSKDPGLLENKLVVAFMVQLRDHLRNYEPVGVPMMCIIQVERFFLDTTHGTISEASTDKKENKPLPAKESGHKTNHEKADNVDIVHAFKISTIHLLGVNSEPNKMHFWGTTAQRQSGSRWLLSSGMGRNFKLPLSKSRAIVRLSSLGAKVPTGNILWSISSHIHGEGTVASSSDNRNPDVGILN